MAFTSVKITANSSDYQSQMKSAAAQMKMLSSEYSVAATKAKLFGKEADTLKAKAESLTQKITVQKNIVKMTSEQQEKLTDKLSKQKEKQTELAASLEFAQKKLEDVTAATGKNSEESEALRKVIAEIGDDYKAMTSAVGKTEKELATQTQAANRAQVNLMEMESELEKVNDELKNHKFNEFTKACESAGEKMENFGKKMSVVSAGVDAVGVASMAAFVELDEGYDTIVTKTGASGDALAELTATADSVFAKMPEDMAVVGEAVGEVNTRFHSTGEELETLSTQFVQFATINDTNVTQSVDQVDKIMKAWNIDTSQTGNLLGLITTKAQETGISVDSLMSNVLDNNSAFKEMGLSLPQAINLMAQFDANGVDTTAALAGLKKALQEATADGKTLDFAIKETIGGIKTAKTETEALQIATELFGKKGAAEMSTAIRENRIDITSLSSSMTEYGSVVADTYNGTLDPIDNSTIAMNNAKLALSTLATTAQESAAPMIEKTTTKIQELTEWFRSLNPAQQETILKVGLVVAAIGPMAVGFGKTAQGISSTVKAGQAFASGVSAVVAKITAKTAATAAGTAADAAATTATAAHTTATTAATAVTGGMTVAQTALNAVMAICPIVLIVALIAGLIAAGIALYKNWDVVKEKLAQLWENIKEKFNQIKESITGAFNNAKEAAKNKLAEMRSSIESTPIGKAAMKVFDAYTGAVKKTMTAAIATAKEKLGNMKAAYEEAGGGIKGVVAAGMEGVKGYYTAGITFVDNMTGGKLTEVKNKWTESFTNIKDKATSLMDVAKENVSTRLDNIKTAYEENGGGIKGIAAASFTAAKDHMVSIMSTADKLTGGKLTSIKNAFTDKLNAAKSTVTSVMENIRSAFTLKIEAAKTAVQDAIDKIKGFFDFEWSLPELKMPHFNITGEFSLKPPSAPKFEIEWYKSGGIITSPTAFGMNGSRWMVGGEAGAEAILPLTEFYARLNQILNQKLNAIEKPTVVYVNYNADGVIGKLQEVKDSLDKKVTVVQVEVIPDDRGLYRLVKRVNDREIELTGNNPLNPVGGK